MTSGTGATDPVGVGGLSGLASSTGYPDKGNSPEMSPTETKGCESLALTLGVGAIGGPTPSLLEDRFRYGT